MDVLVAGSYQSHPTEDWVEQKTLAELLGVSEKTASAWAKARAAPISSTGFCAAGVASQCVWSNVNSGDAWEREALAKARRRGPGKHVKSITWEEIRNGRQARPAHQVVGREDAISPQSLSP